MNLVPGDQMSSKRPLDRRKSSERRIRERRSSIRFSAATLIVVDGITWLDDEGDDRRQFIRRRADRERIAARILDLGSWRV